MQEPLKVVIHIPVAGSKLASSIDPGSAVMPVGVPRQDGVRAVCWESRGLVERVPSTFADRAERAYARSRNVRNDLRKLVYETDFRPIGRLDTFTGTLEIESAEDGDALAEWLGTARLDPAELTTTRGVVVRMVRDLVREHGDLLPKEEPADQRPAKSGVAIVPAPAAMGSRAFYSR